jgi:hypothetical protein
MRTPQSPVFACNCAGGIENLVIMELAPPTDFKPAVDRRKHIPPPPPVSLVVIEDAHLPATTGLERELDAFYVGLLEFERDEKREGVVYKADNFRLIFDFIEGPVQRDDMRMLGVVVRSLAAAMMKLTEMKIEFVHEKGLMPGDERLVLLDPAGNWIRITQFTAIM